MIDSPDGHSHQEHSETQESMFEQSGFEPSGSDPSSFETSAFENAEQEPVAFEEHADAHTSDFPGHDLTELPAGAEADDTFSAETRSEYAEPSLGTESDTEEQADPGHLDSAEHHPTLAESAPSEGDSSSEHAADVSALPLTIDDFAGLEERVIRAIGLVRRERAARLAAEQRAEASESQVADLKAQLRDLQAQESAAEQLHREIESLRAEREQVRQRVERLLGQLDALDI